MNWILLITIISLQICTGNAIKCYVCSLLDPDCKNSKSLTDADLVECSVAENKTCISLATYKRTNESIPYENADLVSVIRSCGSMDSQQCSYSDIKYGSCRTNLNDKLLCATCCTTDKCNYANPAWEKATTTAAATTKTTTTAASIELVAFLPGIILLVGVSIFSY